MTELAPVRKALVEMFIADHADAAAKIVEQFDHAELARCLPDLPLYQASRVLGRTLPAQAARILSGLDRDFAAKVLARISTTNAAAILRACEPATRRELIDALPPALSTQIRMLLNFTQESIGFWMHAEVFVLPVDINVGEALQRLSAAPGQMETESLLVVDRDRQLKGIVRLAALLRARGDTNIEEIVESTKYAIPARMSLLALQHHEVWREAQWVPVVNRQRQFVGILRHVDLHLGLERLAQTHRQVSVPGQGAEFATLYGETLIALLETVAEIIFPLRRNQK